MGWPYTKPCTRCHGKGEIARWASWSAKLRECPRCEGAGRMWTTSYLIYQRLRYGKEDS